MALIDLDKISCLDQLEQATSAELWDAFLEGQANLFFDSEFDWIVKSNWWKESENVLEMGCGNGAYLHRLSLQNQDKGFRGVDRDSNHVEQANQRYPEANLAFREGDAEAFDPQLIGSANAVLFRMTLQHLVNPTKALEHAAEYLSPNGYVVVIDSYDEARRSSHLISTVEKALQQVAEVQRKQGRGNRKITLELLQAVDRGDSPLADLYEVAFSNIDRDGNLVAEIICLKGAQSRALYFNHGLLFLTLVHRTFDVPIALGAAYDELRSYCEDEEAWTSPGCHFLVLRKKS